MENSLDRFLEFTECLEFTNISWFALLKFHIPSPSPLAIAGRYFVPSRIKTIPRSSMTSHPPIPNHAISGSAITPYVSSRYTARFRHKYMPPEKTVSPTAIHFAPPANHHTHGRAAISKLKIFPNVPHCG